MIFPVVDYQLATQALYCPLNTQYHIISRVVDYQLATQALYCPLNTQYHIISYFKKPKNGK